MIGITVDKRLILTAFGRTVPVSCLVRNELNGTRGMSEVVYSENEDGGKGVPYMPRPFPPGTCTIKKAVQVFNTPSLGPWFFATDAHQLVDEWEVVNGLYTRPTGRKVMDWGYGVHVSYRIVGGKQVAEVTSDGCLHLEDATAGDSASIAMTKEEILDWLVNEVAHFYDNGMYGENLQMVVTAP